MTVGAPGAVERPPGLDETRKGRRNAFFGLFAWVGLVVLVATAVVGSNIFSLRDRLLGSATPDPAPPTASRQATSSPTPLAAPTPLRSAPWWQAVTTLEGTGYMSSPVFTINGSASQWRVRWTCSSGRLVVTSSVQPKPLVDAACTDSTVGYGTKAGVTSLEVRADGPWHLEIDQQIDTPLVEPPLPGMTAAGATPVGAGAFYKIDKAGMGNATMFRQPDGSYAVRLEDFFVSPNVDLQLRLSTLAAPRSSAEFSGAHSELVTTMDVTAGNLNYVVPLGLDPTAFRSLVIWCPPVNSAYAAASLGGTP